MRFFFPDLSLHLTATAAGPWRENPPLFIFLPFPSVKGFVGEYFLILKTEGRYAVQIKMPLEADCDL